MTDSTGAVLPLNPIQHYPTLVRGEGVNVWDDTGKQYIDAIAGIACVNIGHGRQRVADAMARQAGQLAFCISNIFANQPAKDLSERVARITPGDLNHFQFTSGGSEAVEVAIKLARQYHVERGKVDKSLVIGRRHCYHGATLGALSATGMVPRREKYLPILLDFPHIDPNYCYRCPYGKEYPGCDMDCATELEAAINRVGPAKVSAFIAEPIVGSSMGGVVPPDEYFPIIREICDRYDVLLIADEVIDGFGRTGKNFAIEHFGVVPDLMTMAKGLTGGYAPMGAVAISQRVADVFLSKPAPVEHIFTYAANPLCSAVACEVQDIMVEEDLTNRATRMSGVFFDHGRRLLEHRIVGDVRGRGLLMGVELVRDATTHEPFSPSVGLNARLARAALDEGVVIYRGGGNIDGKRGDHFFVAPPLTISENEIAETFRRIDAAISRMEDELPA